MIEITKAVYKITKARPRTIAQAIAELKNYLKGLELEDLIPNNNEISILLEICGIYADIPLSELMSDELMEDINTEMNPTYVRTGKIIKTSSNGVARNKLIDTAEIIINLNPDLSYQIEDGGMVFIDGDLSRVFRLRKIRSIIGLPTEFSGEVQLFKTRTLAEAKKYAPKDYWISKKWSETASNGVLAKYFTTIELLNLIANRRLIADGDYE